MIKTNQYQVNPLEVSFFGLSLIDKLYDAKLIGFYAIIEIMESSSVSLYTPVTNPVDFKMNNSPCVS